MIRKTLHGWSIRPRMGKGQRPWLPMPEMSEPLATARFERIQQLATEFVRAGKASDAERSLRLCAEQATPKAFETAERAARRLLTEDAPEKSGPRSFRDVCELWVSGELHRRHPEEVPSKADAGRGQDRAMLSLFYPLLGHKLLRDITGDDLDQAKRLVPEKHAPSTRRTYLARLRYILKLAVDPLRLIDASPVRPKFVPRRVAGRDLLFIYPDEEARLTSCVDIPIEYRLVYGFLCRNGSRISETLRITWAHIDLARGTVRLEKSWTKGKRARFWLLDPDVLAALRRRWKEEGEPTEGLVFRHPKGNKRLTKSTLQHRFQRDLERAQLSSRPELLASSADTRRLVIHDCRGSFVTLARKVGRRVVGTTEIVMNDRWIMDRTGHELAATLAKYDRHVRHARELELPWFEPLDACLWADSASSAGATGPGIVNSKPLPSMDHGMDHEIKKASHGTGSDIPTWNVPGPFSTPEQLETAAAARSDSAGQHLGPGLGGGVDQKTDAAVTAPVTSPAADTGLSESTLRRLLELATGAREWAVVGELSAQLEALEARRAPNVTRIDRARKRGER